MARTNKEITPVELSELYVVDSWTSDEHLWYIVSVDVKGFARCDCPGFLNHGHCKHADDVIAGRTQNS